MLFFFSLILKVQTLSEAVEDSLTGQLAGTLPSTQAPTPRLLLSVLGALVLGAALGAMQVAADVQAPIIKLEETSEPPPLLLRSDHDWHLFLSHV